MAIASRRVSVGTTATRLDTANETDDTAGSIIFLRNGDTTASVDLGPADVVAGAGFELPAGASFGPERLAPNEAVYARAAAGTVVIHVWEQGI